MSAGSKKLFARSAREIVGLQTLNMQAYTLQT